MANLDEEYDDDLNSAFESAFDEGAPLQRKKSGVAIREKAGLKKKKSLRELKRTKSQRMNKTAPKGLFAYDWASQFGKDKNGEEKVEQEKNKERVRVISAKITAGSEHRFEGKWESEEATFDAFLDELNVGESFKKLAAKFGGTQIQKLYIKQDGEDFKIVETNDRRDVFMQFIVNDKFPSQSEKGEPLECIANWEDSSKKDELIIESRNLETEEVTLVRRRVSEDGTKLFEVKEDASGKELKKRTYERKQ